MRTPNIVLQTLIFYLVHGTMRGVKRLFLQLRWPIMQISLEIRPAKLSDVSSISELVRNVAQSCLGADATPFLNTVSPATIESYIQNPIYSYALGFIDNELVGIAAMREKKHFYHLFVSPQHQYKGIAKALWHHLKSDALSNGIHMFTVNSSIYAVPIYKKFGFLPTSEPQSKNGINYVPMQLSDLGSPCALEECRAKIAPLSSTFKVRRSMH